MKHLIGRLFSVRHDDLLSLKIMLKIAKARQGKAISQT